MSLLVCSVRAGIAAASGSTVELASGIAVTAAHLDDKADGTEICLTFSEPVAAKAFTLANPDRVILDFPQLAFAIDPASFDPTVAQRQDTDRHDRRAQASGPGPRRLVGSVRFGLLAPGRSRLVVTLSAPARILSAKMERSAAGAATFNLRLARTDRASFEAGARAPQSDIAPADPARTNAAPIAAAADVGARTAARPMIVIDPGHGGPDTGAERNGLVEKDLTLAFARSLAARLEAGGHYSIIMTRTADVFIPLSERVAIARRSGAALMISVHADTLPEGSRNAADVSGATVYIASDHASDNDAAMVAAKENASDAAAGIVGRADTADVNDILFDLTRQETRAYSHVFARTLVNYWKVVGRLNKNPQRAAGFVVLKAPDVPAVLLELGYLSSAVDAAAFQSEAWREKATARLTEAVDAYFADRHAPPERLRSAGLAPAAAPDVLRLQSK